MNLIIAAMWAIISILFFYRGDIDWVRTCLICAAVFVATAKD